MTAIHIKSTCLCLIALLLFGFVLGQESSKASYDGKYESKQKKELQKLSLPSYQQIEQDPTSEANWQIHYDQSWSNSVSSDSKQIDNNEQVSLDAIIAGMREYIPHSYTFYYNSYRNQRHNTDYYPHLELAYDLQPDSPETFDEFIAYGEIEEDQSIKKEFSQKLLDAEVYSDAELEYNWNTLNSCSDNSILITNGNVDTYPAWIQQEVYDAAQTVKVVNVDLLYNKSYCTTTFDELGVSNMEISRDTDPLKILEHILDEEPAMDTYVALTMPQKVLKKYSKSLYITGLAMRYDPSGKFENLHHLARNWEVRFHKEHMQKSDPINKNYVMMLAILNNYYDDIGNIAARDEVRSFMKVLVPQTGKPAKVKAISPY